MRCDSRSHQGGVSLTASSGQENETLECLRTLAAHPFGPHCCFLMYRCHHAPMSSSEEEHDPFFIYLLKTTRTSPVTSDGVDPDTCHSLTATFIYNFLLFGLDCPSGFVAGVRPEVAEAKLASLLLPFFSSTFFFACFSIWAAMENLVGAQPDLSGAVPPASPQKSQMGG